MPTATKLTHPAVEFVDWGHIDYKQAWDRQKELQQRLVEHKVAQRKRPKEEQCPGHNYLVFAEHNPVFTLGKSGDQQNLLLSADQLEAQGIAFYHIERGGDITYHGPGQLTGYPIWDLEQFGADLHHYLRGIEEAIIQVLRLYDLKAGRLDGLTGVWLGVEGPNPRKICAIGIKCSRWVSMHGFAFNINTDLRFFQKIIPCGIDDKAVTSLEAELGHKLDFDTVKKQVREAFQQQFDFRWL